MENPTFGGVEGGLTFLWLKVGGDAIRFYCILRKLREVQLVRFRDIDRHVMESFRSPNVHSFLAFAPSSGSPRSLLYTTKAALDRSSKEGSVKLTLSVCSNAGSAVGSRESLMGVLKKSLEE